MPICYGTDPVRHCPATYHRQTDSAATPAITTRPNNRADTPAIQQPIDRPSSTFNHYHHPMFAPYCYLNLTTVAPVSLQPIKEELPEDRQEFALIRLRPTDRMIVPICLRSTDRLTDRRALRSTYYHHVDFRLLRLQQTYPRCLTRSRLNRLLLLPPAAKPVPYCLPTPPQAQRKNCQWWNIWTKVT